MADDLTKFTEVASSPQAQAAMDALLRDANRPESVDRPEIDAFRDGFVTIPGGILVGDDVVTEVEVTELTGVSEERLDKARASSDRMRFYNTLLEEGVVSVGGKNALDYLPDMLVGDRETLILGIRKATYGSEIELDTTYCPECREDFDAVIDVKDIPVRPLTSETTFEVKLRKGGKAVVRLPVGSDQSAYLKDNTILDSERNTILLQRCVVTLTETENGDELPVAGFPSLILSLGLADRRNILQEIDKRQPGPRYDGLEIEHECGNKVPVLVQGLVSLFPGL